LANRKAHELTIDKEEKLVVDHQLDLADERHRLTGLVRDRAGGGDAPVVDALVRVHGLGGGEYHLVRTDTQGRFELSVKKGPLSLYARNPDGTRAGFAMSTAGQSAVDIDLREAGRVSGRVL